MRIEVTVPGGAPIVVSHEPSLHGSLKDVEEAAHRKETEIESVHRYARVAVHQAFDAARRRLQDFAREIRRILCPIDFSDYSRRALDHAVEIARWYESRVTVLHVFPTATVTA